MKTNKILSIALLGATVFASAQVKVSGRANLLFKTDKSTWENISNTATGAYNESGKNNATFTPKGLSVAALHLRIFSRRISGYILAEPMSPKPPEFDTAEAKRQPECQIMPPWMMGYLILNNSVILFCSSRYIFSAIPK